MYCPELSLRGAKRRSNPVVIWMVSLSLATTLFTSSPLPAQSPAQRFFETDLTPDLHITWVAVDDFPAREAEAQKILQKVTEETRQLLDRLDPLHPLSETAQLLAKKAKGVYPVSPELAAILATAQEIAEAIDEPLAKAIKVDRKENKVKLKAEDVTINIDPVLKGFLADTMVDQLTAAGFPNSFVELGGAFAARGQDFNGPWKIRVVDQTTAGAQHAFLYKVFNTGAATVNWNVRGPGLPSADLKSVTIFSREGACKAQGLASAVYAMGLGPARDFLNDLDERQIDRAVLIDAQGRFHQFPEEKK